ncbi:unnamed protein product, partial [Nesidiocoris tenuis]
SINIGIQAYLRVITVGSTTSFANLKPSSDVAQKLKTKNCQNVRYVVLPLKRRNLFSIRAQPSQGNFKIN